MILWISTVLNLTTSTKMKKIAFATLGCRVNQYETQSVREAFLDAGYEETAFDSLSDIYFINTCAVTGESVRKSGQMIRRALRKKEEKPDAIVCVCGCFSQGIWDKDDSVLSQVDVIAGNTKKGSLASVLLRLAETAPEKREQIDLREDISKVKTYEEICLSRSHNARAFLKIQDGCNSFCTYCYVPLVRGRVRSRKAEDIKAELCRLTSNGYREIVFTGIETGAWGSDLGEGQNLVFLIEELHDTKGLERIRFGSLKPDLFTDEFCRRLSSLPKVMPHFHLSLQSGSDRVLSAMGRKYSRADEEKAVETIYRYFPDAGLSADIICGFPGETEEDFLQSADLLKKARLLHTHIFPFSPREGTKAAKMTDVVPEEEKKRRCAQLLQIAKESSASFAEKRVGKAYRILCERVRNGYVFGYTENFIYTKTPATEKHRVGDVYTVTLSDEKSFSVETMTVSAISTETVDNFVISL